MILARIPLKETVSASTRVYLTLFPNQFLSSPKWLNRQVLEWHVPSGLDNTRETLLYWLACSLIPRMCAGTGNHRVRHCGRRGADLPLQVGAPFKL